MIHLLEVGPDLSIKDLKKLSRRYAMTGGFEVGLKEGLNAEELNALADIHIPELLQYPKSSATFRSNNSYRVLKLILEKEEISTELREKIQQNISHT